MTAVPQHDAAEWAKLDVIRRGADLAGLALYYNDFSAPNAQHHSRGGLDKHAFGLVLTEHEDETHRARLQAGQSEELMAHPRTRWAATPREALLASLALLEEQNAAARTAPKSRPKPGPKPGPKLQ